jgi:formamidopyrimidine-DNA glycosylase
VCLHVIALRRGVSNLPELPEVETLRRGLERGIQGRCITDVVVANAKVLKEQPEAAFRERVIGRRVECVNRRGKYLLLPLLPGPDVMPPSPPPIGSDTSNSTPSALLCIHLKMRGQLRLQKANDPISPYHCVSLLLDNGDMLRFYDMWTWGEMRALTAEEMAELPSLAGMGPEPLEAGWDGAALKARINGRRGPMSVVAGVGNIYADESLFRAKIHPQRSAGSLTDEEAERLAGTIRAILTEAVEGGGGKTSDEFTDLGGSAGRYLPRVYDRGGQPCGECGTTLTRIKLGGRGTTFCPTCQPSGG